MRTHIERRENSLHWAWVLIPAVMLNIECGSKDESHTNWVPSLENFDAMPYKKLYLVRDLSDTVDFEITVAAESPTILDLISDQNFSVEILPNEDTITPMNGDGAGVSVNGEVMTHDDHVVLDSWIASPPPVLIKVHAVAEEEPARFRFALRAFPETRVSVIVNAGHYQSIVLRRTGSGSSYVQFYHHHGDWKLHTLYQGWFTRCTYAYDCYAGHSIPSWWTSRGDEHNCSKSWNSSKIKGKAVKINQNQYGKTIPMESRGCY